MAERPAVPVAALLAERRLGRAPDDWERVAAAAVTAAREQAHRPGGDLVARLALGIAMGELRGRVPALRVADAIRTEMAGR